MKTKHTPAPWEVSRYRPHYIVQRISSSDNDAFPGKRLIGRVDDVNKDAHANARLIASAPKMYDACNEAEVLRQQLMCKDDLTKRWDEVMKVLANCGQAISETEENNER